MSELDEEIRTKKLEEMAQMQLALGDEKLFVDYGEPTKNYTGERFMELYPERAKAAIKWLAMGCKISHICETLNADHRTIRSIERTQFKKIQEQRDLITPKAYNLTMMTLERMEELVHQETNLQRVSIAHGISRDTWERVTGQPTQRIEIDHKIDLQAKYEHIIRTAEEKVKEIKEAKAHTVEPLQIENGAPA